MSVLASIVAAAIVVYGLELAKRHAKIPWLTIRTTTRLMLLSLGGAAVTAGLLVDLRLVSWFWATVVVQAMLQQLIYDAIVKRATSRGPYR